MDVKSQGRASMVILKLILSLVSVFLSSSTVEYSSGDMKDQSSSQKSIAKNDLHTGQGKVERGLDKKKAKEAKWHWVEATNPPLRLTTTDGNSQGTERQERALLRWLREIEGQLGEQVEGLHRHLCSRHD